MKLLLVEDHMRVANIIFEYFEMKGHVLDHASNGQQGRVLARHGQRRAEDPDARGDRNPNIAPE